MFTEGPEGRNPPLVVVGGYPPSTAFGGGIVLRRLLRDYPRDRLSVFTSSRVLNELALRNDGGGLLAAPHHRVRPYRFETRGLRRVARVLNLLTVPHAAKRIGELCSPESAILTFPWGGELGSEIFVAAYMAHRSTGARLVVYEMDEWRASLGAQSGLGTALLERFWHGAILRAAEAVWTMSDPLADELHRRFGVGAKTLPHCIDIGPTKSPRPTLTPGRSFRLIYAGAVYGAQADSIRVAARAIEQREASSELVLYTNETEKDLARLGIFGERVRSYAPLAPERLAEALSEADALLLPFSFAPEQRSVVSTSFPTKTVDYLASGRPIVVLAPAYSSVAISAAGAGWGLVVAEATPGALEAGLRQLLEPGVAERLVTRALVFVRERHDASRVRSAFLSSVRGRGVSMRGITK